MCFIRESPILVVIHGWMDQYAKIAAEFGYDPRQDRRAAEYLDDILDGPPDVTLLARIIRGKTVLCAGSGPSLVEYMDVLRDTKDSTLIAADSAVLPLVQEGVMPDVIVSDMDGDRDTLRMLARHGVPFVIHAHGDNIERLDAASHLPVCAGTTQVESVGNIQNWGGFTDGDRAVFLASHFKADRIILCGMDLKGPVSPWSGHVDETIKLRKLGVAARLLEWLATFTDSDLYTMSYPLRGFCKIKSPNDYLDVSTVK